MPITHEEVVRRLDTDEPDYTELANLGADALPHLDKLVRDGEPGIAAKAAYLASLIKSEASAAVVATAAKSRHEVVRVAAAAGLSNLTVEKAAAAAGRLLEDRDAGVRKQALRAVGKLGITSLAVKVRDMSTADPDAGLRAVATQELRHLSERPQKSAATPKNTERKLRRDDP